MTILLFPRNGSGVPAALAVAPELAQTLRYLVENLTAGIEATKLAVDAAREAPLGFSAVPAEAARMLESWQAHSLLVHEMFDHLYFSVRDAVSVIRPIAGLPPPDDAPTLLASRETRFWRLAGPPGRLDNMPAGQPQCPVCRGGLRLATPTRDAGLGHHRSEPLFRLPEASARGRPAHCPGHGRRGATALPIPPPLLRLRAVPHPSDLHPMRFIGRRVGCGRTPSRARRTGGPERLPPPSHASSRDGRYATSPFA
jgi:hypothetical protein